jgi:hypothetical protein
LVERITDVDGDSYKLQAWAVAEGIADGGRGANYISSVPMGAALNDAGIDKGIRAVLNNDSELFDAAFGHLGPEAPNHSGMAINDFVSKSFAESTTHPHVIVICPNLGMDHLNESVLMRTEIDALL